jgi:hypothetical protein
MATNPKREDKNRINREYRERHRERLLPLEKQRSAARRAANPIPSREATHRYRKLHPEKTAESLRKWRRTHRATYYISQIRRRSRKNGQEFDLTEQWFEEKFALGSALSGTAFDPSQTGHSSHVASVDRIDNSRGYTMDNCRLILRAENMFKSTMTDEEMFRIAEEMVRRRCGH